MSAKNKSEQLMRVLVVDDHPSAREAVSDVLRQAGYDVATCASATEALARLAHQPVDVIVTDLQMPGMNGLEVKDRLATIGNTIPVIFITAHDEVGVREKALTAGALAFLRKPFDDELLVKTVRQALKEK